MVKNFYGVISIIFFIVPILLGGWHNPLNFYSIILSPAAIILGMIGIYHSEKLGGRTMCIIGIILALLPWLITGAIILLMIMKGM